MLAPSYSKDPADTQIAISKLQDFIDTYPNSDFILDANNLVFELDYRLELKEFNIALQFHNLTDYEASIKSLKILSGFSRSDLKRMYYRFDSAYLLAINSVSRKQEERIKNALSYYRSFKNDYDQSEYMTEIDLKISELNKINNI